MPYPTYHPTPTDHDGGCGYGRIGNGVCADSNACCSVFGWCGYDANYCGATSGPPVSYPTSPPTPTDNDGGATSGQPTFDLNTVTSSPATTILTSPPATAIQYPTPSPTTSVPATLTCPDSLDQSMEIGIDTLYYAVVPSQPAGSGNGLLCGRLETEDHDGWISIGFSADGSMAGSQAIIGVPSAGTVLKYDLTSTATPMSEDRQTLSGTSLTEVNGMVIIEFTKLLIEDGEVPILEGAENTFIYARGHNELGYHGVYGRGSFGVAL